MIDNINLHRMWPYLEYFIDYLKLIKKIQRPKNWVRYLRSMKCHNKYFIINCTIKKLISN